jgi:hypothetical protein
MCNGNGQQRRSGDEPGDVNTDYGGGMGGVGGNYLKGVGLQGV